MDTMGNLLFMMCPVILAMLMLTFKIVGEQNPGDAVGRPMLIISSDIKLGLPVAAASRLYLHQIHI